MEVEVEVVVDELDEVEFGAALPEPEEVAIESIWIG